MFFVLVISMNMNSDKRLLSAKELQKEAHNMFAEAESSEVGEDFDSDDSIGDPDFQEGSSSSSEDDSSEEDDYMEDVSNDNPGNDPTVISEWRDITGNNQQTFAFVENEGLHPNLIITNSFTVLNAYSVFVTENLLEIMVIKTNRNA